MDRRKFLGLAARGAAAGLVSKPGSAQTFDGTLTVGAAKGRTVPASFTGLSYEQAQLTEPDFFSPKHTDLVSHFKRLSPSGLLRIGGNTSEFCWIQVNPSTPAPKLRMPPGDLAENWMPHRLFAIQPASIEELSEFLRATGWKTIFGLNFGNSDPERAATEAACVSRILGDRIAYFQIGNEPDFYRDANNGTRPPGWGFDDYVREWITYADTISARVPNASFGGPDTGASSDWVTRFGTQVSGKLGGRLVALSGHYYAEGPPNDARVTTERLLAGDPQVASVTREIVVVADAHHLQYHMTEGNSCYRGGKPEMSNALASALWLADYALLLATLGCAGINLHGGDSRFLSAGLGDHNPGLEAASNKKQPVTNGFYTPIESEKGRLVSARPIYYGMLLIQEFAGATMQAVNLTIPGNVMAYAATKGGRQLIAIINKESDRRAKIMVRAETQLRRVRAWSLTGPALDATSGVTLGGAIVGPDASWTPHMQNIAVKKRAFFVEVPASSALLLFED